MDLFMWVISDREFASTGEKRCFISRCPPQKKKASYALGEVSKHVKAVKTKKKQDMNR
jgi:hypothetical protein